MGICDLIEYLVNSTENPRDFPISKYFLHKIAQIVCNNYWGYLAHINNKQLTTLLALCDAEDVVQPVEEAYENFMLIQQPLEKQDEVEKLKNQITKIRKFRPEGANEGQFVLKKRQELNSLEDKLRKIQDECFYKTNIKPIFKPNPLPTGPTRGLSHPTGQSVSPELCHWQQDIKKFVREEFGMHAKAKTAFIVELVMRAKLN